MQIGFSVIVIALLTGWLLFRIARNPGDADRDPATTVRRLFLNGLLDATVVLAAQGVDDSKGVDR